MVQAQLDAYNARDLEAWLATYGEDAEQCLLHVGLLAKGRDAIRKRMEDRFKDPSLNAKLIQRTTLEGTVVDHEMVTRMSPTGLETVEMVCIYLVEAGKITKASFVMGAARPVAG